MARVLRPEGRQGDPAPLVDWGRSAAWGVLAGGIIMLLGVMVDLGVLWILQHEPNPQWEFTAVANTVESVPRVVYGLGFLFVALHMMGSRRTGWYRVLGASLIAVGVLSIALAILLVLSYFPLSKLITQATVYTMLRSVAIKTIALCGLYAAVAVPLGVLSLRRPRR
jgi:hypothetical protein